MVEPYSPPTPEGYDGQLPDRKEWLIAAGIGGLLTTAISIWGIVVMDGCCVCVPGPILTMCLSVPTWFMAAADLQQMRQGRMKPQGEFGTEVAKVLGIIGALGGLLTFAALALKTMGFGW